MPTGPPLCRQALDAFFPWDSKLCLVDKSKHPFPFLFFWHGKLCIKFIVVFGRELYWMDLCVSFTQTEVIRGGSLS